MIFFECVAVCVLEYIYVCIYGCGGLKASTKPISYLISLFSKSIDKTLYVLYACKVR